MIRKREVRRFPTKVDGSDNHIVIIEYQTLQESNEITGDRRPAALITGQLFETLDGRTVDQLCEDSFQILGTDKIVRKV
jgi:hypothetical protein